MAILLMAIGGYYINDFCGYFISAYWWLPMVIILVVIGGYW
jgi:hypothetical protein